MVFGRGNNTDLEDRPSNDDAPTVSTIAPEVRTQTLNPDRSWLYRSPGIPGDGKSRSKPAHNPWASAPARPVEPPIPAKPQPVVAAPVPPPMPALIPTTFLNAEASRGPSVYGHELVPILEDPVVAVTKAIVATVALCLGLWFAASFYIASILLFFPFSFNAWEGNTAGLLALGIFGLIGLLVGIWIADQTTWWWGVLAIFFMPIVYAVYVYKQNRGMVSRKTRRPVAKFPTMATIGGSVAIGVFLVVVGFVYLLRNYSDEIEQGVPPFDRYSYDGHVNDEPALPEYSTF